MFKDILLLIIALSFGLFAQISDERVKDFSDANLRRISEELAGVYDWAKNIEDRWFIDMSALVPNTTTDTLIDGREQDGAAKVTGSDITNFITALQAYIAFYEVSGREAVIEKFNVRINRD